MSYPDYLSILELIKQSTKVYEPDWNGCERVEDFDREKFTKLVALECVKIVQQQSKMALEFQWDIDDTCESIKEEIKKHFGVEE
jgi:hypothetical protein